MIIGHKPLTDSEIQEEIFKELKIINPESVTPEGYQDSDYFESFTKWMENSSLNALHGLDSFKHRAYCSGTYDGIQSFVHRHLTKSRIRFSRAEFVGAKIVANNAGANWCYIEDAPLARGDAVVLSLPFSGNGSYHPKHVEILSTCCELDIPVLLDLAYFGISSGIDFDLRYKCISDIVISLSKPMATQLRVGLRFTREPHDDVIQVLSDSKIYNRISTSVATKLLNKFSHSWIIEKYLPRQQKICEQFNIVPTPTVTLAIGDAKNYSQFWREGYYRICITDELQQDI